MRKDRNSGGQRARERGDSGRRGTEAGKKKIRALIGRKSMLVEIDDER